MDNYYTKSTLIENMIIAAVNYAGRVRRDFDGSDFSGLYPKLPISNCQFQFQMANFHLLWPISISNGQFQFQMANFKFKLPISISNGQFQLPNCTISKMANFNLQFQRANFNFQIGQFPKDQFQFLISL